MSKPADRSVGYYQQWGAGALDEKINNYKPQIPAKDWEAIGDFVRSAMLEGLLQLRLTVVETDHAA